MSFRYGKPLSKTHGFAVEWDHNKNKKTPDEVTAGSDKKYWWRCPKEHSYESAVSKRTSGRGCPYCAKKKVLLEESLFIVSPEAMKYWDNCKNGLDPRSLAPSSSKKAWWLCDKCTHSWQTKINSRVSSTGKLKTSCPCCSGNFTPYHKSVEAVSPTLAAEYWGEGDLSAVGPGSHKIVSWRCFSCAFVWSASVKNRYNGTGCPKCSGRVVSDRNRLSLLFPELVDEWSPRNTIEPHKVCFGSDKKYWWACSCGYEWTASPNSRTNTDSSCPFCSKEGPVSKASQKWLDSLGLSELIREYRIDFESSYIKVDGFDPKTNTIYEFLGDFWHGNPEKFPSEDINPVSKKSFGELYDRTFRRFAKLEEAGYNIVFIWEKEFSS